MVCKLASILLMTFFLFLLLGCHPIPTPGAVIMMGPNDHTGYEIYPSMEFLHYDYKIKDQQ